MGVNFLNSSFRKKISLDKFINIFHCLTRISKNTFENEKAFRQEFLLSLCLILVGFLIGETGMQKTLLILSIILIPISEILNYSIGSFVDKMSFNSQHLSQRIKYIGSFAILLAITNALLTWILILFF